MKMGIFRSTSSKEVPGSKAAEMQRPPSYTASNSGASNDKKTAIVVGSNCPCHTRFDAIKSRIEDVSKRLKKSGALEPLERGRLAGLMGIINAPVEDCTINCCCHDELRILETELKRQDHEHDQTRASGASTDDKSASEVRSFEAYAGELRYLCGLLRECKGQIKPSVPAVDVTVAMRSAIQRLEVKVEVLKNRVDELELKAEK